MLSEGRLLRLLLFAGNCWCAGYCIWAAICWFYCCAGGGLTTGWFFGQQQPIFKIITVNYKFKSKWSLLPRNPCQLKSVSKHKTNWEPTTQASLQVTSTSLHKSWTKRSEKASRWDPLQATEWSSRNSRGPKYRTQWPRLRKTSSTQVRAVFTQPLKLAKSSKKSWRG